MTNNIPYEATTGYRTQLEIERHSGIQAFLETLTEEQRRRFGEIAHHLVHLGFEEGSRRFYEGFDDNRKARQLSFETELFASGAGEFQSALAELGKEQ